MKNRRPMTVSDKTMVCVAALLPSLLLVIGLLPFMLPAAQARYKPEYAAISPQIQAWFKNQHNEQGQWCCDESDGHPFFGDYKINEDGSVTIHDGDNPHQLPAYMVLKGPNPTGHAVWWFTDAGGTHRDYCFAPGTMG